MEIINNKPLTIIIFSRNRACQLELTLRSLRLYFWGRYEIVVIYKCNDDFYKLGYEKLQKQYQEVVWFEEHKTFEEDFKEVLGCIETEYILGLADDDVFINHINMDQLSFLVELYKNTPNIWCISLRMNPNCNYSFPAQKEMTIPNFIVKENYLMWDWTQCKADTDWGYPSCINSHLYKLDYIKPIIMGSKFENVNYLETRIDENRDLKKNLMISFIETKIYNVANNFVKTRRENPYKTYDVHTLNQQFLSGKVISTGPTHMLKDNKVHGPIDFEFEQELLWK